MRTAAMLCASICALLASSTPTVGQTGIHRSPPPSGIWESLNNPAPLPMAQTWLLTDGSVLCQGCLSYEFWKLTPDANGSYVNGAWSQVASPLTTQVTTGTTSATQTVASTANM
ncbi:MAG TPA: hypothetical protein VMI31_00290 [Fimbriimonadaceae bacterium]|nr:hypothetical protein [Fimbriimonadaceae bacterium]